jgi:SAM-dependent methyltransferase
VHGQLWSSAAHAWATLQEQAARPLWEAMLDAAAVGRQTRLLDAGCGAGGASVLAADRGAAVNGLDATEALLAIARKRVRDGDFRAGDLQDLPYADASFDAIIAADVLPYIAQPLGAVRELARVCRPSGRIVAAVWNRPEECAQLMILRAVRDLLPACLSEEPLALSAPGALERLLTEAGLGVLGGGEASCPCAYPDGETAWHAQAATGPLQAAQRLVGAGPVRAAVLRALAPYMAASGAVLLVNQFRYVTAMAAGCANAARPGEGGETSPPRSLRPPGAIGAAHVMPAACWSTND